MYDANHNLFAWVVAHFSVAKVTGNSKSPKIRVVKAFILKVYFKPSGATY